MRILRRLEAFFAHCNESALLLHPANEFQRACARRVYEAYCAKQPLEYALGCAQFAGRFYACDEATLIPREDSLALLALLANYLLAQSKAGDARQLKALEIGAGTGVLSITLALAAVGKIEPNYLSFSDKPASKSELAQALSRLQISACDISKKALEIAAINRAAASVDIELLHSDFAQIDLTEFDIVFSNPPYIANNYALDARVAKEPASALFGGELGHEILGQIIAQASAANVRVLACEIGYDQKQIVEKMLAQAGYLPPYWQQDFGGFYRAFLAIKGDI